MSTKIIGPAKTSTFKLETTWKLTVLQRPLYLPRCCTLNIFIHLNIIWHIQSVPWYIGTLCVGRNCKCGFTPKIVTDCWSNSGGKAASLENRWNPSSDESPLVTYSFSQEMPLSRSPLGIAVSQFRSFQWGIHGDKISLCCSLNLPGIWGGIKGQGSRGKVQHRWTVKRDNTLHYITRPGFSNNLYAPSLPIYRKNAMMLTDVSCKNGNLVFQVFHGDFRQPQLTKVN